MATLLLLVSNATLASENNFSPKLTVKPAKCVSLQEDKPCFIKTSIKWQVNQVGDYCLTTSIRGEALMCWEAVKSGHIEHEFKMNADVLFSLVSKGSNTEIATATVSFAWVHKKQKFSHSSWRLF